jgi:hypothetical protein
MDCNSIWQHHSILYECFLFVQFYVLADDNLAALYPALLQPFCYCPLLFPSPAAFGLPVFTSSRLEWAGRK